MDNDEVTDVEIRRRYFKPPTLEEIMDFINEQNVSCAQFERFYRIPKGIMKQVRIGNRDLPVKYWPIIYEKAVPKYGTSFKELNKIIFKKTGVTKKVNHVTYTESEKHNRLNKVV